MGINLIQIVGATTAKVNPKTCNSDCDTGLPKVGASSANLHNLLAIAFGIIAVVAVLYIVIAGLKFVTAQGNPQEIAKARNTIIYALVGLVIAISAETFVALVLNKV